MTGIMVKDHSLPSEDPKLAEQILKAVREVRFGAVQITIHEGRVVQIEKTEKFRVEKT